jgi:micrococcal nuclease
MTRLIALIFFALSAPAYAYRVIGIHDGDTMTLLVEQKPLKIRLANIDAPELRQAYGRRSKESLSTLCWDKDAQFETQSIDRYGRTVALIECDGVKANTAQVALGMAWVYTKYNADPHLPPWEIEARDKRLGVWSDEHPVAPWEWRKSRDIYKSSAKKVKSTKD